MSKNFGLDTRAEIEQAHDLGQAGAADSAEAGEFGLGGDGAGAQELVEVDGEGQEFGDSRQSAEIGRWWFTRFEFTMSTRSTCKIDFMLCLHHASTSCLSVDIRVMAAGL